jgi:hypothetical protein
MIIKKQAAQGDVLFRRVKSLPRDAIASINGEHIVLAHSETGHDHITNGAGVTHYRLSKDDLVSYLRVDSESVEIVHKRSWDTHAPIRLEGGGAIWEVRRQREWTPEGWRRVAD